MSWSLVALALIIPWLAGTLWLRLGWSDPTPGCWPLALGYGYLLSQAGVTLILRMEGAWGGPLQGWLPLLLSSLLALAAFFLLRMHRRDQRLATSPGGGARRSAVQDARVDEGLHRDRTASTGGTCAGPVGEGRDCSTSSMSALRRHGQVPAATLGHLRATLATPGWQRIAFALLSLWLGVRLANLALEVWWQPLYPWDAWTTWGLRARVWAELGELVPFVAPEIWLGEPLAKHHALAAWSYPLTVSLIATWPTLAMGGWNETAANLPWLGAGLALALGFYGQARFWGASPLTALVFLWLLMSLPLLNTQIALAGYADLWQAMALGFTFMAFLQWLRGGERRQGLLTLPCLLICISIKQEGLIWALLFLPALLAARLRRGWLLTAAVLTGAGLVVLWALDGVGLNLPGLGKVWLGPDRILLPGLGEFEFAYHDVWEPVLRHTFLYNNWHLLPYLAILALFAAAWRVWRHPDFGWQRGGLAWALASLAAIHILFFWTQAYLWAEQATSFNRVMLHFAPALTFWMMTVWLEVTAQPDPRSSPR